jgi:hypothetical protein
MTSIVYQAWAARHELPAAAPIIKLSIATPITTSTLEEQQELP